MNKFEYKNLTPFKWFVLENFPFIEADFDALTEWQLFCKLGKEINKIIDSQNLVGEQAETLTNAFNNLKNYVDNYFKNLDVQEEINTKLNKMAEDGTLEKIINQEIFGNITQEINTLNNQINTVNEEINNINNKHFVSIGDSWSTTDKPNVNHFADWLDGLIKNLGYKTENSHRFSSGGSGWVRDGEGGNFLFQLQTAQNTLTTQEKNLTDRVLLFGGVNDVSGNVTFENMQTNIGKCISLAKQIFPNAIIYVCPLNIPGHKYSKIKTLIQDYHRELFLWIKASFQGIVVFDMINWIIPYEPFNPFVGDDELHLSRIGNSIFCNCMMNLMKGGNPSSNIDYYLENTEYGAINNDYMKAKINLSNNMVVYQFFQISLLQNVNINQEVIIAKLPFNESLRPFYWETMSPINSNALIENSVVGMLSVDYGSGNIKFINKSGRIINANEAIQTTSIIGNLY